MPTTLTGLLLFVLLVTPGFCYTLARERSVSLRNVSALRETATILIFGLLSDLITLVLFVTVRAIVPEQTPDLGALVRGGAQYANQHYVELFGWGTAFVLIASILGALMGARVEVTAYVRWVVGKGSKPSRGAPVRYESSWGYLFEGKPHPMHVQCIMTDGSTVSGRASDYNLRHEDTGDRDLTLTAPISYAPAGGEQIELDTQFAQVSARNIRILLASGVSNHSSATDT